MLVVDMQERNLHNKPINRLLTSSRTSQSPRKRKTWDIQVLETE